MDVRNWERIVHLAERLAESENGDGSRYEVMIRVSARPNAMEERALTVLVRKASIRGNRALADLHADAERDGFSCAPVDYEGGEFFELTSKTPLRFAPPEA